MNQGTFYGRLFVVVLVMFLVAGCSKTNPLGPFQPEISNVQDNFQFQATGVTNVTASLDYIWRNSGTTANVNQACAITGGTATLTIFDDSLVQVYTKDLKVNGTDTTYAGITGHWTIRVSLSNVSGTLNFRVQKR
jgi:hypothetical protein